MVSRPVSRRGVLLAALGSTAATALAACTHSSGVAGTGEPSTTTTGPRTGSSAAPASTSTPSPTPSPTLLWSEEFDALDLASSANPNGIWRPNDVWQPINKGYADFGAGGHQCWLASPEQSLGGVAYNPFSVADSVLTITAMKTPPGALAATGGCPWMGGTLVSNTNLPRMTFGYGYYEFRARFPTAGRGMFPALWFYAARDQNSAADKGGAEIDLLEVFGSPTGGPWLASLHEKDNNGQGPSRQALSQSVDTAGWHTYGLDWTATKLDFYYDRSVRASITGDAATFFAGTLMAIRIDYSMNALFFAANRQSDSTTPSPLTMDVDYVRKYDRPF